MDDHSGGNHRAGRVVDKQRLVTHRDRKMSGCGLTGEHRDALRRQTNTYPSVR